MKAVLKIAGLVLAFVLLVVALGYWWASRTSARLLAATYEAHTVDFPVPFPLAADEVAALGLDSAGADRVALERAVERARHLLSARYGCTECHGADLGGGVMVDAFPLGRLLGPNLTRGRGSKVLAYTPADWDRAVRHGILPDGRPSAMPSEDFQRMSDQELSDIIAYINAQPPVDSAVPASTLGPLGKVLVATGKLPLTVTRIALHQTTHVVVPPPTEASVTFGAHLAATCTGCHGGNLAGGPIAGGDPSWPPAGNLTPHGLGSWRYQDFVQAMRQGVRPDGSKLRVPMTFMIPAARRMLDVEMEAMWLYLQSLPATVPGR